MLNGHGRAELVEEGPLPCLISAPGRVSLNEEAERYRWPLLCFLHGYGEGAPAPLREGLTRHGPLSAGRAAVASAAFVVVAPQMPVQGDLWSRWAAEVRTVVGRVAASHAVDPARYYLTGFSFGGNGVFDLALEQPDLWAALWSVDPTRVPERDPGLPVWLSLGALSRGRADAFRRRLRPDPPERRPGTGVEPSPGQGAEDERVVVDRGADHVGTARLAYADERIYRWLLARRRPPR